MTKPFSFSKRDFWLGLLMAAGAPILAKVAELMNVPGFDFVGYNWHSLIGIGVSAGFMYLAKNFVSDKEGTPFGHAR